MKLLVITSYPPKGQTHGKHVVGVASYAKNTILGLKSFNKNLEITVLAEKLPYPIIARRAPKATDETISERLLRHARNDSNKTLEDEYQEQGVKVKRVWKRNSFLTFLNLFKEIGKNPSYKKILIELELAMFGNIVHLALFPLFLFLLRLFGKETTIVLHQVIPDINKLHEHIGLKKGSLKSFVMNFFIHIFYRIILLFSSKIIVFEEIFKEQISSFGDKNKITVIPHGVEDIKTDMDKEHARKVLKIAKEKFVVLYFGFIAWYKGPDILIQEISNCHPELLSGSQKKMLKPIRQAQDLRQVQHDRFKDIQLIIAGGPNPNHAEKGFYQKYVNKIKKDCKDNKITYTGFVKEKEIPLYYEACDLVILPYRTLMSSSGPLSLAFSFEKPFLVSSTLKEIFKTNDIKRLMLDLGINLEDVSFNHKSQVLEKINKLKKNKDFRERITLLVRELKKERNWYTVGKRFYEEIFV